MKMPPDILTFLLRGGHLNVEDRKAKGLWPNEHLRYSEILKHLARIIQSEEWFPRRMPGHKSGDLVYEGTFVERVSPTRFICHSRSSSAYAPRTIAAYSKKEFTNARDAADFYLKWELNLPGNLDSWPVK